MFVARWQFTAQFGKVDDVLSLLRKWEIDVGERVGWKSANIRVTVGVVGAGNSAIELEVRVDSLADLEAAWNDMERNPHHHEYIKQLGHVIVSGTNSWTVQREVVLIPNEG
jgi:hypothetical protein